MEYARRTCSLVEVINILGDDMNVEVFL